MPKPDIRKLDREISELEQPTTGAVRETLAAIAEERQGLQSLADHIASRQATLDKMEATVQALPGVDGPTAAKPTRKKATRKQANRKKATRKRTTAKKSTTRKSPAKKATRPSGTAVADQAHAVLAAADRPLSIDEVAARIEERGGGSIDKRGLAGSLTGGARAGRFTKNKNGTWRLA